MPRDTCTNYNAFGHDPDGSIAYLAAWFFGPNWIPPFPAQVFAGPPQPPRYGPPAAYQLRCLPAGFVANSPPHFFGPPTAPYLEPPAYFHPSLFDALKYTSKYCGVKEESSDSDEGTDMECGGDEDDESDHDGFYLEGSDDAGSEESRGAES